MERTFYFMDKMKKERSNRHAKWVEWDKRRKEKA